MKRLVFGFNKLWNRSKSVSDSLVDAFLVNGTDGGAFSTLEKEWHTVVKETSEYADEIVQMCSKAFLRLLGK